MRVGALLSCLAATPLLVAATGPVRLKPSGPWVLDYAENSCRLFRTFGEGNSETLLILESEGPGRMDMLVTGKPLGGEAKEVPASFLPVRAKPMMGYTAKSSERGPAVLWSRISLLPTALIERNEKRLADQDGKIRTRPPPLDLLDEANTKAIREEFAAKSIELMIEVRRGRPIFLETGPMGPAIRTFDKCSRDSLRDWGVDPDIHDKIVRPAWSPNLGKWVLSEDYPMDLVRRGQQSDVKVRLLIDPTGKAVKCTSLSHFKERAFNDLVCEKIMKRARFAPAELADGTKVSTIYTTQIMFRIMD